MKGKESGKTEEAKLPEAMNDDGEVRIAEGSQEGKAKKCKQMEANGPHVSKGKLTKEGNRGG